MDPGVLFEKPNIYCHFSLGIGEPKYAPVPSWAALNKLLLEGLGAAGAASSALG